jgi:hypothetical protein
MIRNKTEKGPMVIDLTGPEGNAFVLMGYAKNFAKQLGIPSEPIINEMMSGDYENLLDVFDANFGGYVILER